MVEVTVDTGGMVGNNGWLLGDGEIVPLIRSKDWSRTALGPLDQWPERLRATLSLTLASPAPINVIWGPGAVQLYNQAYSEVGGGELGSDFRACRPALADAFEAARAGEPVVLENEPMFLERNGRLAETWFTCSLSPIRDATGVAGVFQLVTETTPRMLADRRGRALRELAAGDARGVEPALEVLGRFRHDLPFLAVYLGDGEIARLAGATGLRAGHALTPALIDVADHRSPIATAIRAGEPVPVTDLAAVHTGPYDEPLERALVLPLSPPGADRPAGALIAGVSTRLELDEPYRGFFDLVAQGVASALAKPMRNAVNRELAAAAAAKTHVIAGISHEIRTPLNAMLGMTSLLLRSPLDDAQREYAQVLRSSGEHLLNLIGDVLDFSKIEAGAIQLERAPFDVRRSVQDAIDIVAVDARAKRLPLVSHIAPEVPEWVVGDSGRLSQILINLLANAVKFTEAGQVTLTLESGAAGTLRFAVADTGIGISAADQAGLFDAFVQVDDHRQGTGLGLAISAQLAELLGGAIAVQSAPGQGSTFTLTIPAGLVDAPAARKAAAPPARPDAALRILVVDDNRANQRVTTLLLGELGYAADVAGDGVEAIEAIERQSYDLVFMDMQMPELDGLEATRVVRRRFPGDRPLIVGLSGYAANDTRRECLAAGMNHYLVKPVTLEQFAETITRLTSGRPDAPPAPAARG
jgi:signal transduction histidine kinase/ActR/RegA family two-component response regulator